MIEKLQKDVAKEIPIGGFMRFGDLGLIRIPDGAIGKAWCDCDDGRHHKDPEKCPNSYRTEIPVYRYYEDSFEIWPKGGYNRAVLLHGEKTGHHHDIVDESGECWSSPWRANFTLFSESYDNVAPTWLKVNATCVYHDHADHGRTNIPKGSYRITNQTEVGRGDVGRRLRASAD